VYEAITYRIPNATNFFKSQQHSTAHLSFWSIFTVTAIALPALIPATLVGWSGLACKSVVPSHFPWRRLPMPNYNAQNPPYSIFPGDVALAFNNEAPSTGQASQQFALPSYAGFPENGRTIRWQVSFATAPTAVTIQLQTAMNDVDAQYAIPTGAANMTTSLTAGDNLIAAGVRANFVRAKVTSITGGTGVTVQILG
jgi:hypothetical protein